MLTTCAGALLALLFRVEITNPLLYFVGLVCAAGTLVSLCVLPRRWLVVPLMLLMVTMPDLTQIPEDVPVRGVVPAATAWQIGFGPVSPAIVIMGAVLVAFLRLYDGRKHRRFQLVVFYFGCVPAVVALYFGYAQEAPSRFLTDAKVAAFFCIGLLTFSSYYARFPAELLRTTQVCGALLVGVVVVDALNLWRGLTAPVGELSYTSLSLDTTKGLAAGVFFWALARLASGRSRLIATAVGVITCSVIVAYQTRWLIVTLAAGIVLVLLLLGRRKIIAISLGGAILLAVTLPFLKKFYPEVWGTTLTRFAFLTEIDRSMNLLEVEAARTGAIYNSMLLVAEKRALLTGLGYGSWFTDSYYPMPGLSIAAFDQESLESGRFYRVHDFAFHYVFKFGLIGLLLYCYVFIRPLYGIWKVRDAVLRRNALSPIAIVIFGLMPTVLTAFWFSGKGLLFSAWYVVAAGAWGGVFKMACFSVDKTTAHQPETLGSPIPERSKVDSIRILRDRHEALSAYRRNETN